MKWLRKVLLTESLHDRGLILAIALVVTQVWTTDLVRAQTSSRERISLNRNWRFTKGDPNDDSTGLIYDVRPEVRDDRDDRPADAMPTEAVDVAAEQSVLKPWILPTGNDFIKDPSARHVRPEGNPGGDLPYVQSNFDDNAWRRVNLPHDWAIEGPFQQGRRAHVGGGMGRLPSPGIGWYRKKLDIPVSDVDKSIFLDIDGAMSYAMVWLNGKLVGGWPYGYASWRVDLTPYVVAGGENQLAIRLDNPPSSSRWYPGGGIYRNVWLVKTDPVHVAQWGTYVTTREASQASATINLGVSINNDGMSGASVEVSTSIYSLNVDDKRAGDAVADIGSVTVTIEGDASETVKGSVTLENPRLWGPPPMQTPLRYVAVTTLRRGGNTIDQYETRFGIRSLHFDPDTGIHVNGERIYIKGANQHHDLGALGAAFNVRAAERQLESLREMGCNAIRMAHNPPAPELLELTDRMGFLVVDEIFDVWARKKTPLDFHLIFPDWHEQDTRAFVRRDRNHPSVILWSFGNEVGEQYTGEEGAAVAKQLRDIVKEEDPTRPTTTAMNFAKPDMPLPEVPDVISLNYQGEGIRDAPAYAGLRGIRTSPLYPAFHEAFPEKVILSSENAAALSTRGTYLFPVNDGISAPVKDGSGGDPNHQYVSAYELYTAPFGSSADKVFASLDKHPYVAGGFVWSGWDYLGEPTPYYGARSSYFGVIDLAGFKKDRFYLYQSHWRPDLPMAHILSHWNWPDRVGEVTPVHVFTSGDEAELFLNGKLLSRKKKGQYEYRLRWDDVVYEPGELKVVAYKDGDKWAEDIVKTTDEPAGLEASADRSEIRADGEDLAFVTVRVVDKNGLTVPRVNNQIKFNIEGLGEIVATDNGDPTNLTLFSSHEREAFNGLCLAIIRGIPGQTGMVKLTAESDSIESTTIIVQSVAEEVNSDIAQQKTPEAKGHWVTTWGSGPQLTEPRNLPPAPLADSTLRQFVHATLGGQHLRVRLSNAYGTDPVTMNSVHVALSAGEGSAGNGDINAATDMALTFSGALSITVPPGEAVYSDPFDFNLPPLTSLAVTIYFGSISATTVNGHPGSRTHSFIQAGNVVSAESLPDAAKTAHWYIITGIDVQTEETSGAIVVLGDSITDGRGSTTDGNNRWPDNLARRLATNPPMAQLAVVNMGIGGNAILRGGLGPTAQARFDRDVLGTRGVRWLILFEGVNDIGGARGDAGSTVATSLIDAYQQLIAKAKVHNVRVYGATITPFGESFYDRPGHEAARQTVNNWIRNNDMLDAVIDFDAAVRDPSNPKTLLPAYDTGDHLHLSPEGYQAMADAIDLSLFTP